jgi:hypothetical protein
MDKFAFPQLNDRAVDQARFAASRDRILLTLLALNLMLVAFFVVLNSAAKIDHRKASVATQSLQASIAPAPAPATSATDARVSRSDAVDDVRNRVAAVFAPFIADASAVHASEDRIDVDVPPATLSQDVLSGIARVVAAPPAGYRVELLVQGARTDDDTLAALAAALVGEGSDPSALAIGTRSADVAGLRFTFLLLDPGADAAFAQAVRSEP